MNAVNLQIYYEREREREREKERERESKLTGMSSRIVSYNIISQNIPDASMLLALAGIGQW